MLELAILGLLKDQDLHGYELKRRLTNTPGLGTLGLGRGVSFGSLYPALRRLERAGAVEAVEPSAASGRPVPMTGSLGGELAIFRSHKAAGRGGRGKKVYGITPRGEALFDELLVAETQSSDDDRVFNLRLAFARYLPPDARLGLLERRRAQLLERLVHLRARLRGGREPTDGYARSLMEHDQETAEHDLSWIERLIAIERARGQSPERRDGTGSPDTPGSSGTTDSPARSEAPTAAGWPADSQRTPGSRPTTHSLPTTDFQGTADSQRRAGPSANGAFSPSIAGLRSAVSQEDNTA
jgi:DNA-binding PadR family transcriptional regulator